MLFWVEFVLGPIIGCIFWVSDYTPKIPQSSSQSFQLLSARSLSASVTRHLLKGLGIFFVALVFLTRHSGAGGEKYILPCLQRSLNSTLGVDERPV